MLIAIEHFLKELPVPRAVYSRHESKRDGHRPLVKTNSEVGTMIKSTRATRLLRQLGIGVVLLPILLPNLTATAQQRGGEPAPDRLREVLDGLERGMAALEELGRRDALEHLQRIADDVRQELGSHRRHHRDRSERALIENQLETLRLAIPALREGGRLDSAELVEHAIRAREMMLEGRRDLESRMFRNRAPDRGQIVELLALSEALYREFGMVERARQIDRLADELWAGRDRPRGRRRAERERRGHSDSADEHGRYQLQVMEQALHVLKEAEREDAADLIMRAIKAHVVELQGRRGAEAEEVRRRGPDLAQQVEILHLAARLWEEFGNSERAQAVRRLAERMWEGHGQRHERDEHRETSVHHIELLQERVAELQEALEEMRRELAQLKRRR